MDFNLKLKAMERLVDSEAPGAEDLLRKELARTKEALGVTPVDSSVAVQQLELLDHLARRFPSEALATASDFVRMARAPENDVPTYVVAKAIDIVVALRYADTKRVFRELLQLVTDANETIRKKARDGLVEITRPDIRVLYGTDQGPGLGALPQLQVLEELEKAEIANSAVAAVLVDIVAETLTPTMESTRWTSTTVTISRAAVPAGTMGSVRERAIALLEKVYRQASDQVLRRQIIGAMQEASRFPDDSPAALIAVISRDTVRVLKFFAAQVESQDLPLVQKLEHAAYWMYYHAANADIERSALEVGEAVNKHDEYAIYKILIGFEGIFGDWAALKAGADRDFEGQDKMRRERAGEFARSITEHNFATWKARLLKYASVESDDLATFPVFYFFLEEFAKATPLLALRLLREADDPMERFLIPLLRGVWFGPSKAEATILVGMWIDQAKHLPHIARQFMGSAETDVSLLRRVLQRAEQVDDLIAVSNVLSVAVTNSDNVPNAISELFVPALRVLVEKHSTGWMNDVWFRRELRRLIPKLQGDALELLMRNLKEVPKIGHQVEEILFAIAQHHPKDVIALLAARIETAEEQGRSSFDALPYKMHKLDEALTKVPVAVVAAAKGLFTADRNLFEYRGARLIRTIFPTLEQPVSDELMKMVANGREDELEFVASVLLAYEGEQFIHTLSKEIIRRAPPGSRTQHIVARALWRTGVVAGEYGMAEAFERKANDMAAWLEDPDPTVRAFAADRIEEFKQDALADRQRAKESIALRRHRFGENLEEG